MRDWWPRDGLHVNPGRRPTHIGSDGVEPFVDVPHWFTADLVRMLRRHRVDFSIHLAFARSKTSDDPDDQSDRLSFRRARPEQIQALVDSITPRQFRAEDRSDGAVS